MEVKVLCGTRRHTAFGWRRRTMISSSRCFPVLAGLLALCLTLPLTAADVTGYVGVMDGETFTGIAGLRVLIFKGNDPGSAGQDAWMPVAEAETDADGRYEITALPARYYRLWMEGGVATNGTRYLPVDWYNFPVTVETTEFPDLITRQAAFIWGYVKDTSNQPIQNAQVEVYAQYTEDNDNNNRRQARTNADGLYEVPLAHTDKAFFPVEVSFASRNTTRGTTYFAPQIAPDLYAASPTGTRGPDFSLAEGGVLHGYVFTPTGLPVVANNNVINPAAQITGGLWNTGTGTDNSGEFWLYNAPTGVNIWLSTSTWGQFKVGITQYMWGSRYVGPYQVTAGQVLTVPSLYVPQAGTIKVTVTNSSLGGAAVDGASVNLMGYDIFGGMSNFDYTELTTDTLGQCVFDPVPPGQYRIRVAKGGMPGMKSFISAWFPVVSDQETPISATLENSTNSCAISGIITNFADVAPRNGPNGLTGDILPFNIMDNYDRYGRASELGVFAYLTSTDWTDENLLWPDFQFSGGGDVEDGYDDYFVPNTRAGTYTAQAYTSESQSVVVYRMPPPPATAPLGWCIVLSDPQTVIGTKTGVNFTLPVGNGTVSGTVSFPANYTPDLIGANNGGITIYLRPSPFTGMGRALAQPGPSLKYGMTKLPAGTYTIYAVARGMTTYTSASFTLADNQTVTKDFTFTSAAANQVPAIDTVTPSNLTIASATEGNPLVLAVTASDPNTTDSLRYSWWTRPTDSGAWTQVMIRENDPLTLPTWAGNIPYNAVRHPATSNLRSQIKVVVKDNYDNHDPSAATSVGVKRIWTINTLHDVNRAPDFGDVTAEVTGGTTRSVPLVCTLSGPAVDPDTEDTVTYTYTWSDYQRTEIVHTTTNLYDTLAVGNFSKNQTWFCTVGAKDQLNLAPDTTVTSSNNVTIGNSAPVVVNSAKTVAVDETLSVPAPGVLQGASDADSEDTLTATWFDGPEHGDLFLYPDGSYDYSPDYGFIGEDSFTFQATDGDADSNIGMVTITVADRTPPIIMGLLPVDGDTAVDPIVDLRIDFSENVVKGTGDIVIQKADGTVVETIPVGDVRVTLFADTVTINPAGSFVNGTSYYVTIAPTCFKDAAGNYFAGITGNSAWNFAAAPGVDNDLDGLDDVWENNYFGGLQAKPEDDPDGDGFTNLEEYAGGTDPLGYDLVLEKGWNLVSIAKPPEDPSAEAIFVDAQDVPVIAGPVWVWDAAQKHFTAVTTLDPLRGYWVFAPAKVTVHVHVSP